MNKLMNGVKFVNERRFCLYLAMAVFGFLMMGCSTLNSGAGPTQVEDLALNITLDKSAFRPGEAMLMTVSLTNVSSVEQPIRMLDAQSVEFWFHLAGSADTPIRREPVISLREQMNEFRKLAPGESVQRQFLLTRMTHFSGNMIAQAQYKQGIPFDAMKVNKFYSNVTEYEVHGEPIFEREDAAGIIVKDAAISLAKDQCPDGDTVLDAQALLIEDEMGFYCYWVNLKIKNEQGADSLISYLVDPYQGEVKGQAKPFDAKAAQDPRLKRPGTLPKSGIPTHQVGGSQ